METLGRLASTALTIFSGVAFGVMAMTGVVAAVVFPTMRSLDPALPAFSGYSGPHWSLAAGTVAERIFVIGFIVTGVCLGASVLAVIGLAAARRGPRPPVVRIALLFVTLGVFLTHVMWLQPRMDEAAVEYREAAGVGDSDTAGAAKSRFDAMHPIASNLIAGATAAALGLFVASAWASGGPRRVATGSGAA